MPTGSFEPFVCHIYVCLLSFELNFVYKNTVCGFKSDPLAPPLCCIVPQVEAKTLQSALQMTTPTTPPVKSTRWVKWGSCHKSFGLEVLGCRWLNCWFLEEISKRILQFCKWFRESWVFMLSEKHFGAGPECRLQQTKLKNDDMGNWEPTQKHILESFYQVHPVNLKL